MICKILTCYYNMYENARQSAAGDDLGLSLIDQGNNSHFLVLAQMLNPRHQSKLPHFWAQSVSVSISNVAITCSAIQTFWYKAKSCLESASQDVYNRIVGWELITLVNLISRSQACLSLKSAVLEVI